VETGALALGGPNPLEGCQGVVARRHPPWRLIPHPTTRLMVDWGACEPAGNEGPARFPSQGESRRGSSRSFIRLFLILFFFIDRFLPRLFFWGLFRGRGWGPGLPGRLPTKPGAGGPSKTWPGLDSGFWTRC